MLFNSLGFIAFLIVVLILYYSPVKWVFKKWMLLLASYVFYGLWNPPLVILLWISTLVDWTAGNMIFKTDNERKRKLWLLLSLVVNLGFLGFFKYGGFLLENFTLLLNAAGMDFSPAKPDIILPMGISFYTFQLLAYQIDAELYDLLGLVGEFLVQLVRDVGHGASLLAVFRPEWPSRCRAP